MSSAPESAAPPASDHNRWFVEHVRAHEAPLKAYLRGVFPAVRDVDDVVQESYLRICRARAAHPIASARAFLFRVARNVALDIIRRVRRSPIDSVEDLAAVRVFEEGPDAAAAAERREKAWLLGEALASLPERNREIIMLRKFKEIPQKEVAAHFGLSEEAVEHHVARGLKRCEAYLRKRGIRGI